MQELKKVGLILVGVIAGLYIYDNFIKKTA